MSDEIELHDSKGSIRISGDALLLSFCPAYVRHWEQSNAGWHGEGRSQSAEVILAKGSMVPAPSDGAFEVSDGWFEIDGRLHQRLIPVPFEKLAPVRGGLELIATPAVELSGEGIVIRLLGEPEYVEDLPPEWAPR